MGIDDQRASLCAAARRLAGSGLAIGNGGNLSTRVGDHVLMTPADHRLESVSPEQLVVVDLDGTVAVPTPYRPSSEIRLHLDIYRATSTSAIAHAHPISAVAVANIVGELPAIHYTAAMLGGTVRVAPYAVFGSAELSDGVIAALHERTAALMCNHGALTLGSNIETAYEHLELLDWLCEVYLRCLAAGRPAVLDDTQLTEIVATGARRHYTPFPGSDR
ncbi:MAG: class II aldolase/adducin family protein [Gordonia sp. (in: high G+C Gram-positive bacteria)]